MIPWRTVILDIFLGKIFDERGDVDLYLRFSKHFFIFSHHRIDDFLMVGFRQQLFNSLDEFLFDLQLILFRIDASRTKETPLYLGWETVGLTAELVPGKYLYPE